MFLLSRGHHVMSSTQLRQLVKLPFAKTLTTAAINTTSLHNFVAGQHISLDLPSNALTIHTEILAHAAQYSQTDRSH